MLDESRITDIMKSKEKAAQRKWDNYQSSGVNKYYTEYQHYDDLANICRIALSVSKIREENTMFHVQLPPMCDAADRILRTRDYYDPEVCKSFLEELVMFGRQHDLYHH